MPVQAFGVAKAGEGQSGFPLAINLNASLIAEVTTSHVPPAHPRT